MSVTNPRVHPDTKVAFAWQAAEGTAANIAAARLLQVDRISMIPNPTTIHPRGTTGSIHPPDTHRLVALEPKATLRMFASVAKMDFLLESVTSGQPTSTLAAGDLTESGDGDAFYSAWVLNGVRPGINTDAVGKVYVSTEDEQPGAGQVRISVFSDEARSALVAQGSGANSTTITLAEQNNSGLSGMVAAGVVTASDVDIELTIARRRFIFASAYSRFFTLWRDHGAAKEAERLTDCVVTSLTLESSEREPLMLEAEIMAKDYDKIAGGGLGAVGCAEQDILHHQVLALRTDTAGTPVTQAPISATIAIVNSVRQYLADSDRPSKLIKLNVEELKVDFVSVEDDESVGRVDAGIADTFDGVDAIWTLGTKALTLAWSKTKPTGWKMADFSGNNIEDHTIEQRAVADVDADDLPMTLSLDV